jgi:hypothetical protein
VANILDAKYNTPLTSEARRAVDPDIHRQLLAQNERMRERITEMLRLLDDQRKLLLTIEQPEPGA